MCGEGEAVYEGAFVKKKIRGSHSGSCRREGTKYFSYPTELHYFHCLIGPKLSVNFTDSQYFRGTISKYGNVAGSIE